MAADRFSLLAGIVSDWWWEMGPDLRFTFLSDRLQSILGLPVSSLIGKRRNEVPRTDYDNPAWRAHLDDLEQHRPFRNFETTVIDAAGVSRPVMISGTSRARSVAARAYASICPGAANRRRSPWRRRKPPRWRAAASGFSWSRTTRACAPACWSSW